MCRRVNSEKPGPLRDRMEAMLYGGTSPSDADRAQNLKSKPAPTRRLFSTPVVAFGSCVRSQATWKARRARWRES